MIRTVKENDLSAVMQIWLDTNIKTHSFISKYYWMDNYDMVKKILPLWERSKLSHFNVGGKKTTVNNKYLQS